MGVLYIFLIFWILWHIDILENLSGWGESAPPRANGFLEEVEPSLEHVFYMETKHPELRLPHLAPWATGGNIICLCLNHPKARSQTSEIIPVAQYLLKLLELVNPELFYPAFLSNRNPRRGHDLSILAAPVFCLLTILLSFQWSPVWHFMAPVSRTCEYNKLVFLSLFSVSSYGYTWPTIS